MEVGGGQAFAGGGLEGDLEVEPLFTGGGDGEAGFDAFEVAVGAELEPFLQGDFPFPFESGEGAGEESEDRILTVEMQPALAVGTGEPVLEEALEGGAFGGGIAGGVSTGVGGVGEPDILAGGGEADGEDTGAVLALEMGGESGQTAGQVQVEAGGFRGQLEIGGGEVGFQSGGFQESGVGLAEESGDLGAGESARAPQHSHGIGRKQEGPQL